MDDIANVLRNNGQWVHWESCSQKYWAALDEGDRHSAAAEIDRLRAQLAKTEEALDREFANSISLLAEIVRLQTDDGTKPPLSPEPNPLRTT